MASIAAMGDEGVSAFVNVAIGAIVVAVIFGLGIANGSSLVSSVQTKIEDGMVQLVSLVILLVLIFVLGALRKRV